MSTQVTYETDHVSLLCDSPISSALNFYFLCVYCSQKQKDLIRRSIGSKKQMFICEIGIIILIMLEISVDWAGSTKR